MFAKLWLFLVGTLLGSPIKLLLWFGNRILTWTGLAVVWKKLDGTPNRTRRFIVLMCLINLVSVGVLILVIRTFVIH